MVKNRLFGILSRIVDIKPGEEILAILLFFYFFLITAPHGIINAVRDTKYLIDRNALDLPIAYLLTAALMGFVVAFHSKIQESIPRNILIRSSLMFFIVTCFIFGLLFFKRWMWVPVAFWIWASVFIVVLMTQFWILINDIFNPREAKRLIGFFVSGGILGGISGNLLTGFLAKDIPDYLFLIACGMLLFNVLIVNSIFSRQRKRRALIHQAEKKEPERRKEAKKVGFKVCFETVRKDYYLRLLAAVVTLTWIVSTFVDWQFKNIVESGMRPDYYMRFFGFFNAGLLILPFFLQLFITSKVIKRYGIRLTLLIYPFVLLICLLGIAAFPIIYLAGAIKGSDKGLSFSLNQSVRELLYIPISPILKLRAKIFIDMFVTRFAKGIGALILMIFMFLPETVKLDHRIRIVSLISVAFITAWVVLNLKLSKEYTNIVKQKLEIKWERADRIVDEKLDVDFMKLVIDTLEDKNRSSVLYAMDVFDLMKQDKLTPEVKKLISYKQDEVRASSLGSLLQEGETGIIPEMDDYISEEVLTKEIEEIMSLDVYQEVMKSYVDKVLIQKNKNAEIEKMEVAKALGLMDPQSPLVDKLDELLNDESPEVVRLAIESAAKLKRREYVPAIVQKLDNSVFSMDARTALEKYGPKIVGTLSDYFGEPEENSGLRKGIVSILARIGTQEAADFLLLELTLNKEDISNELIDALDHIRSNKPDVELNKEITEPQTAREIKHFYQLFLQMYDVQASAKEYVISTGLPRNLEISLMNIFKLMGLVYPNEEIIKAYQNIKKGTKDSMAYAIELLDNVLLKEIKDVLFPLIDDLPLEERVMRCRNLQKTSQVLK